MEKEKFPGPCIYRKFNGTVCVYGGESRPITPADCVKCKVPFEERILERRKGDRRGPLKNRRILSKRPGDRRKGDRRRIDID